MIVFLLARGNVLLEFLSKAGYPKKGAVLRATNVLPMKHLSLS